MRPLGPPIAPFGHANDVDTSIAEETPIRVVLRALRGRWRLVMLLSAVLATIGGAAGLVIKPAKYVSRGLVRLDEPQSPLVSRRNRPDPVSLEAFIASQLQVVQSRAVLEEALGRPAVIDAGWPGGDTGLAMLQGALQATRGRRENLIRVSVTHPDPAMAETAVNAILATLESRATHAAYGTSEREAALVELEAQLTDRLETLNRSVLEQSDHYGPDGIERLHAQRVEDLLDIDRRLARLRGSVVDGAVATADDANALELAGRDDALLRRSIELLAMRATLSGRFLPAHPVMLDLNDEIEQVRVQRELQAEIRAGTSDLAPGAAASPTAPQLAPLQAARDRLRDEVEALSVRQLELRALSDRAQADRAKLAETRSQLDELRMTESHAGGRVTISVWGERPVVPTYDHRASLAAGGALAGALAGVGLVFLLGILDRRARFVDELLREADGTPVIGVLPNLDTLPGAHGHRATDAVHEMRNLLDRDGAPERGCVTVITGCARGEGRTSVALALGTSFAVAGHRTLLIDGDRTRPQLSRTTAAHAGGDDAECLRGALDQWPLRRLQHANLWMLPSLAGAPEVSRATLQDALDAARRRFDVILVDTGPAPVCADAPLLATLADRVIVTVRRGERIATIGSTLARLRLFGAAVTGVVFNRADAAEWKSIRSRARAADAPAAFVPADADDESGPYTFARTAAGAPATTTRRDAA